MKNTYFISDPHFGHKNIIKYANRPFTSVDEMDETIIKNWNGMIGKTDEVYLLGDVSLTNSERTNEILNELNGRLYLIKGNHEKSVMSSKENRDRFEWIKDYYELKYEYNGKRNMIVMCHYAMRVWNKSHHGSYHLYGHSHDSLEYEQWGKSMDVGIDSAARIFGEYRPFTFDEIDGILSKRVPKEIDHHVAVR
jgi:calcineurin-like phosphoesterase family protein